jgi:hypothetical protein
VSLYIPNGISPVHFVASHFAYVIQDEVGARLSLKRSILWDVQPSVRRCIREDRTLQKYR